MLHKWILYSGSRPRRMFMIALALTVVLSNTIDMPARAQTGEDQGIREEEVSFQGKDVTLHGTVLVPEGDGKHPAIALVAGAGLGERDANRKLAEEFANAGIVTLIYDKRTKDYSAAPTGPRSFSLLADDAVAAVRKLQTLSYVDPASVGLWGVSEGGWVVPLAATKSDDVAFIITLAGTGVSPSAQVGWSVGEALDYHGVTARSIHRALVERASSFIVSAELMAEPAYDPVPVLEKVKQPVLAVWGAKDTIEPASESATIMQAAFERGGNQSYTLRFIQNGDHDCFATQDGFTRTTGDFAPGCVTIMTAWVTAVTSGQIPQPAVDPIPTQAHRAPDTVRPKGYDLWYVQVGNMVLFTVAFMGYGVVAMWRWAKKKFLHRSAAKTAPSPVRWFARSLAIAGTATWVYFNYYLFSTYIALNDSDRHVLGDAVIAGRTGTWLTLQIVSLVIVVLGILLVVGWWQKRNQIQKAEQVRLGVVLAGVVVFIPWAVYWQLLTP